MPRKKRDADAEVIAAGAAEAERAEARPQVPPDAGDRGGPAGLGGLVEMHRAFAAEMRAAVATLRRENAELRDAVRELAAEVRRRSK